MYKRIVKLPKFQICSLILIITISAIAISCKENKTKKDDLTNHETQYRTKVNWIGHWQNEGKRQQLVDDVASEFEFLNQDVKVNLIYMDSIMKGATDAMEIDLIIKEATSLKPRFDIIRVKDYYSRVANVLNDPEWARKYLVDFSEDPDFRASHQQFVFDDEYKADNGGITIGPYNEGFYYALWYNKEVAEKMGLKIKPFSMTAEDFIGYLRAAYEYNIKNNTSIAPMYNAYDWLTLDILVSQLFFSLINNIDDIKNSSYSEKKINALERVLKVFDEMGKFESSFKDRSKYVWWTTIASPLNGESLFYLQGSWMYNIWDNVDKIKVYNMIPVEIPTMTGTAPCYPGGFKACWAVLKNAPHKAQAIKLMKYWSSSEISENWVRYTKCPTAVKGNLTEVTLGLDQFEDFQYQISKKYNNKMLKPTDNRYILGIKNKDISIPVIDIIEHRKTSAQLMSAIKSQIKR